MSRKLLIILCATCLAHAGIIRTNYEPATSQVIYSQPESSSIYEYISTQDQSYDPGFGSNQDNFKINELQITPSSSGDANIQAVQLEGSGSLMPSAMYHTSAALPKPVSLPSYSIGSSKIIYNSKVTPGLSAYAS